MTMPSCGWMSRPSGPAGVWLAQRPERRPHFGGEQVWLFPGGEVAASVERVVVDEVVGIRALGPAAGDLIELVGEDADGKRNRDGLGVEEVRLVLPIQAGRGNPRAGQPLHRDVFPHVLLGPRALPGG